MNVRPPPTVRSGQPGRLLQRLLQASLPLAALLVLLAWCGLHEARTPEHWPAIVNVAIFCAAALAGAVAGFFSGLLGIGGSLIVVPALYLLLPALGVAESQVPHAAIATALAAMVPSALRCTWIQHRIGGLDHCWLRRIAPGATLGGAAGALCATQLHGPALALLFAAQSVYFGSGLVRRRPTPATGWRARIAARCAGLPPWSVAPSAGAFSACIGMGAGSLFVPYLALQGLCLLKATACSAALNLSISAGATLALWLLHTWASVPGAAIHVPVAMVIGLAAAIAVPAGVAAAPGMPLPMFRRALGFVHLASAMVLLWRTLQ